MNDVQLGTIPSSIAERDAIHIAVAPATAGERLSPGQRVSYANGIAKASGDVVGIVDPYLTSDVFEGERFWLCLLPNTVAGMRHHWSHPAFGMRDGGPTKEDSEYWLRSFLDAADISVDYEDILKAATTGERVGQDDYLYVVVKEGEFHIHGRSEWAEIPPEFWDHVENVTGKRCLAQPEYFSCGC